MRTFYIAYCSTIYLGFIVFVVVELQETHPDPWSFALMFLTLWPLLTMMVGYEGLIHVESDYMKNSGVESAPKSWPKAELDGIVTGALVVASGMYCFWWTSFDSLWVFAVPVLSALLLPGIIASSSIKRIK